MTIKSILEEMYDYRQNSHVWKYGPEKCNEMLDIIDDLIDLVESHKDNPEQWQPINTLKENEFVDVYILSKHTPDYRRIAHNQVYDGVKWKGMSSVQPQYGEYVLAWKPVTSYPSDDLISKFKRNIN